jgi:hypothetical protein
MKGRKPSVYRLRAAERRYLRVIVGDGQQSQRVATRARPLLALDRGERVVEVLRCMAGCPPDTDYADSGIDGKLLPV